MFPLLPTAGVEEKWFVGKKSKVKGDDNDVFGENIFW